MTRQDREKELRCLTRQMQAKPSLDREMLRERAWVLSRMVSPPPRQP